MKSLPHFPKSMALIGLIFLSFSADVDVKSIPDLQLKDMEGNLISTGEISTAGHPTLFCFWATWCSPCKRELNNYAELYEDWQEETGLKLIAVSIDDSRNADKVKPYVDGQSWDYEVYLDVNGDFKRAMNVNNVPHTFLLDGNKKIVWQHNSYSPGDEDELYELVKKLANGESID